MNRRRSPEQTMLIREIIEVTQGGICYDENDEGPAVHGLIEQLLASGMTVEQVYDEALTDLFDGDEVWVKYS